MSRQQPTEKGDADGSEELYDLRNDPNEWNNLAGKPEFAGVKEKMAAAAPKPRRSAFTSSRPRVRFDSTNSSAHAAV